MQCRIGFLAFVMYVTLDLSNPFIAGAFNFSPDECVEATQRHERAGAVADRAILTAERVRQPRPAERQRGIARAAMRTARTDWRSPTPVAHVERAAPPSLTEDH